MTGIRVIMPYPAVMKHTIVRADALKVRIENGRMSS
jgi:hypothetical protein